MRKLKNSSDVNKSWFTLVELIVVITILAILGTIGFLSFQSYNTYARDSVRLWNLKTIESGLWIMYVQGWNYALPDDSVNITASWTIIRKQWVFWKNALRTVRVSKNGSKDPLTEEYFDYTVWSNLQEYQLVAYLEWDESFNPNLAPPKGRGIIWNSYANIWTMKSVWSDIWIVYSWWLALHKTASNIWNDFDIRKDWDEYTVKFSEDDKITSSGSLLFSSVYNHSKKLLKNKDLAKLDDSLVLYFDMETTTMSWSEVVLKDLSKYGNNWELKWWIKIWTEIWVSWKSTYFDWVDDYIDVWNKNSLNLEHRNISLLSSFTLRNYNDLTKYNFLISKWEIISGTTRWFSLYTTPPAKSRFTLYKELAPSHPAYYWVIHKSKIWNNKTQFIAGIYTWNNIFAY